MNILFNKFRITWYFLSIINDTLIIQCDKQLMSQVTEKQMRIQTKGTKYGVHISFKKMINNYLIEFHHK